MSWEEYLNLNDNNVEGKKCFIVDVRLSKGDSFIRNVPPTEVIVVSNDYLPKGKVVYYSDFHFLKLNKKGVPLKQVIAPYDNTGYRSYSGVSVNVFDNYDDAVKKYNEQLEDVKASYLNDIDKLRLLIDKVEDMKL